jgi:hypothetical protein
MTHCFLILNYELEIIKFIVKNWFNMISFYMALILSTSDSPPPVIDLNLNGNVVVGGVSNQPYTNPINSIVKPKPVDPTADKPPTSSGKVNQGTRSPIVNQTRLATPSPKIAKTKEEISAIKNQIRELREDLNGFFSGLKFSFYYHIEK